MSPHDFIGKWRQANLSERSACQQHFLDLCELLGQPKPAAADPEGAWYTFERGVNKTGGGHGWLNPPEWTREKVLEFPGTVDGPWSRYVQSPDARGIGLVRYPRLVPRDAELAAQLSKRTLTNLYNQRPSWLDLAHRRLDAAVLTTHAWPENLSDDELLSRLLELNLARAPA